MTGWQLGLSIKLEEAATSTD